MQLQKNRMSGKNWWDIKIIKDFIEMCKMLWYENIWYWTPECEYRIYIEKIEYAKKSEQPRFVIMDEFKLTK